MVMNRVTSSHGKRDESIWFWLSCIDARVKSFDFVQFGWNLRAWRQRSCSLRVWRHNAWSLRVWRHVVVLTCEFGSTLNRQLVAFNRLLVPLLILQKDSPKNTKTRLLKHSIVCSAVCCHVTRLQTAVRLHTHNSDGMSYANDTTALIQKPQPFHLNAIYWKSTRWYAYIYCDVNMYDTQINAPNIWIIH